MYYSVTCYCELSMWRRATVGKCDMQPNEVALSWWGQCWVLHFTALWVDLREQLPLTCFGTESLQSPDGVIQTVLLLTRFCTESLQFPDCVIQTTFEPGVWFTFGPPLVQRGLWSLPQAAQCRRPRFALNGMSVVFAFQMTNGLFFSDKQVLSLLIYRQIAMSRLQTRKNDKHYV